MGKAKTKTIAKSSNDRRTAVEQLLRITHDGAYRSLIDRGAGPRVVALVSTYNPMETLFVVPASPFSEEQFPTPSTSTGATSSSGI